MTMLRPFITMASSFAAVVFLASSCSLIADDESVDEQSSGTSSSDISGTEGEAEPVEWFKVIGKDIVDPDGNLFVPVGANVGPPLKDTEDQPIWLYSINGNDVTSPESVAAVNDWGWNFLRVNSSCDPDEPNESNSGHGNDEMFTALDKVVDTYTAEGVVVMIACHDFTANAPEVGSAEHTALNVFWEEASERYGENSLVWFNHMNEPHVLDDSDAVWQAQVDDGYQTYVDLEVKNLLVFDLPNQGQQLDVFEDLTIQDWAKEKCNVVWSWHSYGGLDSGGDIEKPDPAAFEETATSLVEDVAAAEMPVVVGEFGYDWDAERQHSNFSWEAERAGGLTAVEAAPAVGYGLVVWHANGDSGTEMKYGLKNSDSETFAQPAPGENLSEIGSKFWEHSQQQKGMTPQPGPSDVSCVR